MYVCCVVPYMLKTTGFDAALITKLCFVFNIPYTTKVFLSIVINRLVNKPNNKNIVIKSALIITQTIVCILLFNLQQLSNILCVSVISVLTVAVITIQDIIIEYIRLKCMPHETIALSTTIGTVGYKIGQLFGGAIVLQIQCTSMIAWVCLLLNFIFMCVAGNINYIGALKNNQNVTVKHIIKQLLSSKSFAILVFFIFYKSTDVFIHTLKPVILYNKGFADKSLFANNAQINSFVFSIVGNAIMFMFANKINSYSKVLCLMKIAILMQIVPAICWYCISKYNLTIGVITLCISASSVIFGFAMNAIRIFLSYIANKDVDRYIFLTCLGSVARLACLGICSLFTCIDNNYCYLFIFVIILNISAVVFVLTNHNNART